MVQKETISSIRNDFYDFFKMIEVMIHEENVSTHCVRIDYNKRIALTNRLIHSQMSTSMPDKLIEIFVSC